jgi:hypothetical protein
MDPGQRIATALRSIRGTTAGTYSPVNPALTGSVEPSSSRK